ncbi:hypothetical protein GS434_17285 [Rhodococcus hoagii]|nr:hypothetical protein [Prescottella equi]
MPNAQLVTVPGVELIKVGSWDISTGKWNVTPKLLHSAVEAATAGVVRRPPLKLGHDDPRFDGEPAVGYIDNLRITDGGRTLVGDYVGVPKWLADVLATAYPSRSVEGVHDVEGRDGTKYPFVLTACALLGVTNPGITSIADLPAHFGVAAKAVTATFTRTDHAPTALAVALAAARRNRRARHESR